MWIGHKETYKDIELYILPCFHPFDESNGPIFINYILVIHYRDTWPTYMTGWVVFYDSTIVLYDYKMKNVTWITQWFLVLNSLFDMMKRFLVIEYPYDYKIDHKWTHKFKIFL
jgi:hypothetical protein